MKHYLLLIFFLFTSAILIAQEEGKAVGVVINVTGGTPLENVNIVNLNKVGLPVFLNPI